MAIGDTVETSPDVYRFECLASTTATNSPPSGESAGLDMNVVVGTLGGVPREMHAVVISTAGSVTMTATIKVWGYVDATVGWVPDGTGADTDKGKLNAGTALGETSADSIKHSEVRTFLGHYKRVYFEITAIGGTSTAVTGYLVGSRRSRRFE